jgi:hypothetical protein
MVDEVIGLLANMLNGRFQPNIKFFFLDYAKHIELVMLLKWKQQ